MEEFKIDPTVSYDVVELPSRGIYYANGKKSLRVAYLTAADENILTSLNLAQSNTMVDELLKRKILDRDINIQDLVDEDREAVLIFLRNTAFGTDYNVTLKDPKTGEDFKIVLDLSSLSFKNFNLKPDTNGEFPYYMEKSKTDVTFTFLNQKDEKELRDLEKNWKTSPVIPFVTKRLEKLIKSVNGNRDPMSIYRFIETLPIKDSQDFRKYVDNNKPGLNLIKTVKAPSGEDIQVNIGFGVEFFRPFYGV